MEEIILKVENLQDPLLSLSESDKKVYLARVVDNYDIIEKETKWLISKIVYDEKSQAQNWEQVLICRGSVNFGELLLQRFDDLKGQYNESTKEKEPFDQFKPISEE